MTSSALFIIVAESIVIFRPMSQVGCASACAGVTAASSLPLDGPRNGPPLAVSTTRLTSSRPAAPQRLEGSR